MSSIESKREELERLRQRIRELEAEIRDAEQSQQPWQATRFYTAYYATTGFMLGMFAAAASLLFNVVGSLLVGQHPLQLIRVYLTFPMGEKALDLNAVDGGLILAIGCCLYLATGMLLGVPFYLALVWLTADASFGRRLLVATVLSIGIWIINYYAILSWLQPLLFGGNWIVEMVPWWVAALTHLVFGWTMALIYPWGTYVPYRPNTPNTEQT